MKLYVCEITALWQDGNVYTMI